MYPTFGLIQTYLVVLYVASRMAITFEEAVAAIFLDKPTVPAVFPL